MHRALCWLLLLLQQSQLVIVAAASSSHSESFTEDLLVKPLPDGRVLLHFEFDIHRPLRAANETIRHYHLFPRQIGEISRRYDVDELHLSFTQGNWRQRKWGYPPARSHGVGAEVRARLKGGGKTSDKWKGLTNALSGVFCASLNYINEENTSNDDEVWRGYLPRENVCTENLTPWIKQLPCQSKSGIGSLLNPYRLYQSDFHSMGLSLETIPDPNGAGQQQQKQRYRQHLSVVVDTRALDLGSRWTLQQLMDRKLVSGGCAAARRSSVRVHIPSSEMELLPKPPTRTTDGTIGVYDLATMGQSDIEFVFTKTIGETVSREMPPLITAHRYVTGHGVSNNQVEATITNHGDQTIAIKYLDTLPWFLRVYSHTLSIQTVPLTTADGSASSDFKAIEPTYMHYTPAIDRGRPSIISLSIDLPAHSRTILKYRFDKGFLKYTEHPPDANRGFNIGPAVISYQHPKDVSRGPLYCEVEQTMVASSGNAKCTGRVYTELFLASLPTPDFSMPYNVITFTCTILALFFGRIFSLLSRDFAIVDAATTKDDEKVKK